MAGSGGKVILSAKLKNCDCCNWKTFFYILPGDGSVESTHFVVGWQWSVVDMERCWEHHIIPVWVGRDFPFCDIISSYLVTEWKVSPNPHQFILCDVLTNPLLICSQDTTEIMEQLLFNNIYYVGHWWFWFRIRAFKQGQGRPQSTSTCSNKGRGSFSAFYNIGQPITWNPLSSTILPLRLFAKPNLGTLS